MTGSAAGPSGDLVVAIDGGSQSTKVSVFDAAGVLRASAAVPLRPYALGPGGRAVHPDDDLWDSLGRAARAALAQLEATGGDPARIVAVGLCGIRFCRALVDDAGRLTEPVLSWMDARVSAPLTDPDPAVSLVTSAGGYLAVRLTGQRRDSAASYRGMWPLDPLTHRWSTDPEAARRTGMPTSLLPELVDPGDLLGEVSAEAAAVTGLREGLPVHATANDKAVEALGAGLIAPGPVLLSLGTYIASMTVAREYLPDTDDYWVNAAAVPRHYLLESGGIRRGMWTVSWLRQLVSAACPDPDPEAVQAWLDRGAADVEPGCGGLMTVPDWLAPGHAPYRRGAILGLDGGHGAPHLFRSILEGIALTMRDHTAAMEAALGRPDAHEPLVISGGGSRSALFAGILADVFDRPVERAAHADAAALGAAICAAVGHGLHLDLPSAVSAMVRPGVVVHPDPARAARYAEIAAVYRDISVHTDPLFQRSAVIGG